VLRFVIHAVHETGSLMKVIGSDGLDKKSRLAAARILYICKWHQAVPRLVAAFHEGAHAFHQAICSVVGLRGELTRKEILILFGASRYSTLRAVGAPTMPFGQGAKNGAKAFLGVPQRKGPNATAYYHEKLLEKIPRIEATMSQLFPELPKTECRVTLGDIEPCLCAAFVYSGLVRNLRKLMQDKLGKRAAMAAPATDPDTTWKAVEELRIPAGFYAYSRDGHPVTSNSGGRFPRLPYQKFRLQIAPREQFLTRQSLFRRWGPGPAEAASGRPLKRKAPVAKRSGRSSSSVWEMRPARRPRRSQSRPFTPTAALRSSLRK